MQHSSTSTNVVLASVERALRENEQLRNKLNPTIVRTTTSHQFSQQQYQPHHLSASSSLITSSPTHKNGHKLSQFVASPSLGAPTYNSYFGHVAAASPTKKMAESHPALHGGEL